MAEDRADYWEVKAPQKGGGSFAPFGVERIQESDGL